MPAPGQAKKIAMLGSLDHVTRQLIVHTSPTKRSSDFIAHPGATRPALWTAARTTDQAGRAGRGQWSDPLQQTLARRPGRPRTLAHPRVAAEIRPELNEIEPVWRDLKAHHLAHQTFTDIAALDQAIHDAVIDLNRERIPDPWAIPRISA